MPFGHVLGPMVDKVAPSQIVSKRMGREWTALRFLGGSAN